MLCNCVSSNWSLLWAVIFLFLMTSLAHHLPTGLYANKKVNSKHRLSFCIEDLSYPADIFVSMCAMGDSELNMNYL